MNNYDEALFVDQEKKFRGFQKLLEPATRQAIMLIEAPKDMGKTWLVGKMQRHCLASDVMTPVAVINFRNPREIHEIQDILGLLRLLRDKLNRPDYFNYFNAVVNEVTESRPMAASSGLLMLRQNMEEAFNLEELNDLAFALGINYENIPGDTLSVKAREMISYCQRHGLLRHLVALCEQERPYLDWWQGLESLREMPGETAVNGTTAVADNNAPFRADSNREQEYIERQLNDAFFECLSRLLADAGVAAFLFDSYETAPPEAERWLRWELLPRLNEGQLADLVVIVAGRKTPDLTDLNIRHLLVQTTLSPFTEEYVREYFVERRRIEGLDLPTVLATSGGVPGTLAIMADHAMATTQDDDDFFADL